MNKQELIKALKEEHNDYHPEYNYDIRLGFEAAIEMVEEILEPTEPEPLVIPQFVADFIEKWKNEYLTMSEWFSFNYDDDEEHEVFKWLYDNDYEENTRREYLLINAIRYGYEIEKEKLYYIKFSENQYAQKFDGTKIDSMLINEKSIAGRFTKEEIEKMNPNLMSLAVEVEVEE